MKKILISAVFALFMVPTFASASSTLSVFPSATTNGTYYNAVTKAADHILALQNTDGGMGWDITGETAASGASLLNVTGVTAETLLSAYTLTGKAVYLDAAKKAGDYIISTIDVSVPKSINGYNILFLKHLSTVSGVASYSDKAAEYFADIYSNTPTTLCVSGCTNTTGLYSGYIAKRGSTANATIAWDLEPFVEYATLAADTVHASEIETQIVADLSVAEYVPGVSGYDLGLASGLKAASLVGDTAFVASSSALLFSTDGSYGTMDDGKVQATAYALKAFIQTGDSRATTAAAYLTSTFGQIGASSGWLETDGSSNNTEYAEDNSEAASAIAQLLPQGIRYYSIQTAYDAATPGDTINVAAGNYTENVTIGKALTISGPNASVAGNGTRGGEATVTGKFLITSSDVTLKGMKITNPSWTTIATVHGVQIFSAGPVISNITVSNNVFSAINNISAKGAYAVMVQGVVNGVTVSNNKMDSISSNGWAHAIEVTPTSATSTVPQNVTVSNNVITNVTSLTGDAFAFSADSSNVATDASQISFHNNSFVGGNVKNADTTHALDASTNFWGENPVFSTTSPRTFGNVIYSPWYASAAMTDLASSMTTTGEVKSETFAVESKTTVSNSTGTVSADIPANITITGPTTWDGTFDLPTATTTSPIPFESNGSWLTALTEVAIGSNDVSLAFDQPIKLTFVGQAGKHVGWSRGTTFQEITSTCTSTTVPTLGAGEDCKADVGADLVIWTRHATTFVTYTQVAIPYTGGGSSSSNGGGSSAITTNYTGQGVTQTVTTSTTGQVLGTSVDATAPGMVLGATAFNFTRNLRIGANGDDVTELQKMLIGGGYLKITTPTKYFGGLTRAAVVKWQAKNKISATGYFGPISRAFVTK